MHPRLVGLGKLPKAPLGRRHPLDPKAPFIGPYRFSPQETPPSVLNLSCVYNLTHAQVQLLDRGLKFISQPLKLDHADTDRGLDRLIRSIKIKFSLLPRFNFEDYPFRVPSSFIPFANSYPPIIDSWEKDIRDYADKLQNGMLHKHKAHLNPSPTDHAAIKSLKSITPFLIIKPADKGACIVLQDRTSYTSEAQRHLQVAHHYMPIPHPLHLESASIFRTLINKMKQEKLIPSKVHKFLLPPDEPRPRQLYFLPKIHKPVDKWPSPNIPPGRPIVSDLSSDSSELCKFIDFHLRPHAISHPSFLKNTEHFLQCLQEVIVPPSALLISLDVDALYTNLSLSFGMQAVQKCLDNSPSKINPYILELLHLTLHRNDFLFDGSYYVQRMGVSMGRKYAPAFADISMAAFEAAFVYTQPIQPLLYKRYLDDIFLIWTHSLADFQKFFQSINSAQTHINLKADIQTSSIEFLDVQVFKGPRFLRSGILDTKVYFKPTNSLALLHYTSYHPKATFRGIVKSQFIRYTRICNNIDDAKSAMDTLSKALTSRNYPVRSLLAKVKREVLDSISPGLIPGGMHPHPTRRCQLCQYNWRRPYIPHPLGPIHLHDPANCKTLLAIYLIICESCDFTYYVGQTTNLRNRMCVHISNIRLNHPSSVATHFNTVHGDNPLLYFKFTVLETFPEEDPTSPNLKLLSARENFWIKRTQVFGKTLNSSINPMDPSTLILPLKHSPITRQLARHVESSFQDTCGEALGIPPPSIYRVMVASKANPNTANHLIRAKLPHTT